MYQYLIKRFKTISFFLIYISQLQIQLMIWASTLQIRKLGYFGDLDFIILFVGILPMYAINLGAVSLFTDSPFMFLAMFVSDVLYRFEWTNIVLFLSKFFFLSFWFIIFFKRNASNTLSNTISLIWWDPWEF